MREYLIQDTSKESEIIPVEFNSISLVTFYLSWVANTHLNHWTQGWCASD